jgi:hypothetical protein
MSDFNMDHYVDTDCRYYDLSRELNQRMDAWLHVRSLLLRERVFNVVGSFGSGRSWFLKFVDKSSNIRTSFSQDFQVVDQRYRSVYLDLHEGFSPQREKSPKEFVLEAKNRVEEVAVVCEAEHAGLCLCVDHVPGAGSPMATEELRDFEEAVLLPALEERNAFLVIAKRHQETWGFTGLIPHVLPQKLAPFNAVGIERLCDIRGYSGSWRDVFRDSLGNPYLANLLIDLQLDKACKQYIKGWLMSKGLSDDSNHLLYLAEPLAFTEPHKANARQMGRRVLEACGRLPASFDWEKTLDDFRLKLEWLHVPRRNDGRFEYRHRWVAVVQHCLQVMFKEEDPHGYREVKEVIEGGSNE